MPKTKKKEKIYQKPTEEQLSYLRNKSKVKNTYRSTQNWINKFQEYCSDIGLEGAPENIDDTSKLETQLYEYFTVAKKNNRSEYTVSSLLFTIRAINRFYNSNISKVTPVDLCDKKSFPTNLASSMSSTLTTQDASLLTPQPANSHEFQNSKVPLQELPLVSNQNHEMQEFFQRNLFMNSNITFYIHNHYYTLQQ
ncbi:6974_t:CDS:2 [Dentiscutata heterogama]|uniref:6974_t:CDS:1 n=1 Tax=Dentiscutata heterogama TaxID=1316150 RepID=A0ACA9LL15_9GLOM|nr:6974_t:CDS:2 [Dentiscutata heterogama]